MPVLNLQLLQRSVIEADSVSVLLLPLFGDFLLLDHHVVGALLVALMPLLGLQQLILKVSHFYIAFIIKLVNSAMEHNLEAIQLGDRAFFFISELVDELAKAVVVVEVALVVAHV